MAKAIILFLDSARGQYIPRDFAQSIKRDCVRGGCADELTTLADDASNELENYWDLWETVLSNARIEHDGHTYTLHHDGDLWLIDHSRMTQQERENFGFEG